ncbi:uncharacterized protein [Macrobrachium rosenbergii]|uniref:uncharacterized protein n=1 Tax=Macrobrachium rosenbergii TaxID=79674 RepID=UPI0034D4EBFA
MKPKDLSPSYQQEKQQILFDLLEQMLEKRAVEQVSDLQSLGFYNRLFLVPKQSEGWRPVLDVSSLNHFVLKEKFKMETSQSIYRSLKTRRLDGFSGSPGRLLSRPYTSSIKEVPEVCPVGTGISIQGSLLRAKHSPYGLHGVNEECGEMASPCRDKSLTLFGRLAHSSLVDVEMSGGPSHDVGFHEVPRTSGEFRKVPSDPDSVHRLSGDSDGFSGFSSFSVTRKTATVLRQSFSLPVERNMLGEGMVESAGDHFIAGEVCFPGVTTSQTTSILPCRELAGQGGSGSFSEDLAKGEGLPKVVARSLKVGRRRFSQPSEPRPSVVFRCVHIGMGSNTRGGRSVGYLERGTSVLAHKSQRIGAIQMALLFLRDESQTE